MYFKSTRPIIIISIQVTNSTTAVDKSAGAISPQMMMIGTIIGTKASFPSLNKIPAESLINSAFITFEVDSTLLSDSFPAISTVVLAEVGRDNKILINNITQGPFLVNLGRGENGTPGIFDNTNKTYSLDVTAFLQDVLNGRKPNTTGLVLLPASLTQNSEAVLTNSSLSRVVIRNAKLDLYYSKK